MATWGSDLKKRREKVGWSQYKLAGRTGIGREKISRFECGYTQPSSDERAKIAAVLDQAVAEEYTRLAELRSARPSRKTSAQLNASAVDIAPA